MKKFMVLCLVIVSTSLFTGCDDVISDKSADKQSNRFVRLENMYHVGNGSYVRPLHDTETGLMFWVNGEGAMCPMTSINRMGFASQMTYEEYTTSK